MCTVNVYITPNNTYLYIIIWIIMNIDINIYLYTNMYTTIYTCTQIHLLYISYIIIYPSKGPWLNSLTSHQVLEPPKPGKIPLSAPRSRRHCLGPKKKNERTQQLEPAPTGSRFWRFRILKVGGVDWLVAELREICACQKTPCFFLKAQRWSIYSGQIGIIIIHQSGQIKGFPLLNYL